MRPVYFLPPFSLSSPPALCFSFSPTHIYFAFYFYPCHFRLLQYHWFEFAPSYQSPSCLVSPAVSSLPECLCYSPPPSRLGFSPSDGTQRRPAPSLLPPHRGCTPTSPLTCTSPSSTSSSTRCPTGAPLRSPPPMALPDAPPPTSPTPAHRSDGAGVRPRNLPSPLSSLNPSPHWLDRGSRASSQPPHVPGHGSHGGGGSTLSEGFDPVPAVPLPARGGGGSGAPVPAPSSSSSLGPRRRPPDWVTYP